MGCCVSTHRDLSSASSPPKHQNSVVLKNQAPPRSNSSSSAKVSENRAPPEEETVKEVLPETHKWRPQIANLEPQKSPQKPEFHKFPEVSSKINKVPSPIKKEEEISEVSEACSLSESMMSTTTTADRKEDDDEIRQRVSSSPAKMRKNRSFSGDRRDKTVGKSPTRRPEQSPGRRNIGSARQTPSRDQLVRSQTMGNRGMRGEPRWRDAGENSSRRSRSPAMRTDNGATRSIVGRSPSKRRPNQSPARARTPTPENGGRRKEHSGTEGKWPSASANESLENPLVSLECFIFL
ncbi:serine/arginine repetitive matrix protein 1-like [Neltuma alba]|uniref:serine/arginine repetitive matrix protein 1 n=1 Tax=Neltuma alba TaxID=207710 RepID=UPI0010A34ECB|nr:serine/arginine repetitive matrix protein 1 [Prosopis alba]XP_028782545.1 serine/arginine repetitive matrix protein 1-like [Prosopis alba]